MATPVWGYWEFLSCSMDPLMKITPSGISLRIRTSAGLHLNYRATFQPVLDFCGFGIESDWIFAVLFSPLNRHAKKWKKVMNNFCPDSRGIINISICRTETQDNVS